jgi:hypothetical protein
MSDRLYLRSRVIVLTERGGTGVLFDGVIGSSVGDESLADAVLRALRKKDIDVQAGDVLFFPDAHAGHRTVAV